MMSNTVILSEKIEDDYMVEAVEDGFFNQKGPTVEPSSGNTNATLKDIWTHRRVLLWCILVYLLPINFGYEGGMVGNLLAVDSFLERFGHALPSGQLEIAASSQQILNAGTTIGIFCSAFGTGFLSDIFGRRIVVLAACIICLAGTLVQYYSTTIIMLFGGKLIVTFGFGLGHSLGPVFVAELAPTVLRGTCLSLVNTMIVIGHWTSSLCVYGSSNLSGDASWRVPVITQVIPPCLLLLLGAPLLPESPCWLLMKGKREQAIKSFKPFNGQDFDAERAVQTLEYTLETEKAMAAEGSSYLECFKGTSLRRTTIICMVYIAQQFIGVNFIAGYLPYYFTLAGVQNALAIAQVAYAIQLFGNLCSWSLIDRYGRRTLVVYGTIVMTASLLIIGGISTINSSNSLKATVALMCIWGFIYQATLGPAAYAVGGETSTPRLRQKTYAINIMSATAVSCMGLQVTPFLINPGNANLGGKITLVFFFPPSVLVCIYLYFCFPEMKDRTYLELEEMFQARVPSRKFKSYVCQSTTMATDEPSAGDEKA
ncbi:hypothetical protein BP5796_03541 [Coleophoma crateriformis]|uniref:Major facilitator superfamily (MFS) profile domain-containing protein n=1 Tax=Coleophoma crateriformis TaxID=565419 RepID=A0A3D8SNG8_9HELO|nr:hypothetical protein BP5796_03541 [Coleophoma crateriformis]